MNIRLKRSGHDPGVEMTKGCSSSWGLQEGGDGSLPGDEDAYSTDPTESGNTLCGSRSAMSSDLALRVKFSTQVGVASLPSSRDLDGARKSLLIACLLLMMPMSLWAGHDHEENDFEIEIGGGWTSGVLMPESPFGGNYLGDFFPGESVSYGIMDALPTGGVGAEFGARWVELSFDIINYDPSFDQFTVTTQSDNLINLETDAIVVGDVPNLSVESVFYYPGTSNDLWIEFSKPTGVGNWGLDNVTVDWNINNVPEPSTTGLMLAFLIGLLVRRRR